MAGSANKTEAAASSARGETLVMTRTFDAPRALTLFSTLALNVDRLSSSRIPANGTDVTDADGIVYR